MTTAGRTRYQPCDGLRSEQNKDQGKAVYFVGVVE
jgi:hypothetical protein